MSRIAAGLVAVACLGTVATASAHEKSFKTSATVDYEMRSPGGNAFAGEVEGRKSCLRNRSVKIVRQGAGGMGSTQSRRSGRFELSVPGVPDGSYRAKVRRRTVKRTDDHKHVCKGDRSPAVAVAGSCSELVLSGGPSPADTLSVDDDIFVGRDSTPVLADDDDVANDHAPVSVGATTGGEEIEIEASNSFTFGGPVSIDPLWIHCQTRAISFALDPEGFAGTDAPGEIFYDRDFIVPDMVP